MICVDGAPRRHTVGPQVRRPRRRSWIAGSSAAADASRRTRRHGSTSCVWRWDLALVFLLVRPRLGLSVPWTRPAPLSHGPGCECLPPLPVAAGPCPVRTGHRPCPLPLSGTEPATPHLDVVPRPPSPVAPPGNAGHAGLCLRGLGAQVRVRRAFSRAGCDFGCWRWWSRDPQRLPWVPWDRPSVAGLWQ